jgi:hypothetical protein
MSEFTSGRSIAVGLTKEVTFGTGLAPTSYLKVTNTAINLNRNYVESEARLGNRAKIGNFFTNLSGDWSVDYEADCVDIGWYLKMVLGGEATPVKNGTSNEWTHTFKMAPTLPSYTLAYKRGGVDRVWAQGAKADAMSLEVAPNALITGSVNGTFRDQLDGQADFTPAYNTLSPLTFRHATVTFDGASNDITQMSLNIGNALKVDDFRMDGTGKLKSITPTELAVSGSFNAVFGTDSAPLETAYAGNLLKPVVLTLDSGVVIDDDKTYKLTITMSKVQITNLTVNPEIDGMTVSVEWQAFYDATDLSPIVVDLVNNRATVY